MIRLANNYLKLKMTNLYHYKNGIVTKVKDSKSGCDNGVAYDEVNRLIFLGQTHEKNIRIYKYGENGEVKLIEIFIWDIKLIIYYLMKKI